jgi:hypothetical protein
VDVIVTRESSAGGVGDGCRADHGERSQSVSMQKIHVDSPKSRMAPASAHDSAQPDSGCCGRNPDNFRTSTLSNHHEFQNSFGLMRVK